jgi:hypothetical protein
MPHCFCVKLDDQSLTCHAVTSMQGGNHRSRITHHYVFAIAHYYSFSASSGEAEDLGGTLVWEQVLLSGSV